MLNKLSGQGKILALLGLFVIYVCLELSLNLLLIDMYAKPLQDVFGEHQLTAERLELFGRTLSGFGLALGIISFVPGHMFNFFSGSAAGQEQPGISNAAKWLYRPIAFILLWALIIPALRLGIDGMVEGTSNDKKLSAVRAIVYKEAYLAEAVTIEGFPEFDEIVNDPQRKDLMVALIPSLAYFSAGFNHLIESNLQNMADVFLQNRQEEIFTKEALPRIRKFDSLYKKEWASYKDASKVYIEASRRENNFALIEQERTALLNQANERINQQWKTFSEALLNASDYRKDYAENETVVKVYRDIRDKYQSSKCDRECKDFYKAEFAKYINNLTFEDGERFGVYLTPEKVNLTKMLKSKYQLMGMFNRGREAYLYRAYGVSEEMEYQEYSQSQVATNLAINLFKENDVHLGKDWNMNEMRALRQAIIHKYQGRAEKLWVKYQDGSSFGGVLETGIDRVDFARLTEIQYLAKAALGPYYMDSFTPTIAESRYKKMWLASQDNISFIKMVTSTAATAAFSTGGSMFQLGKDAVKLAVIPPVSIAASLLAILLLFIKLGMYLWTRSKVYLVIAMLFGVLTFGIPVAKSVLDKNSYHGMMVAFAEEFSDVDTFDKTFTVGFGYVLDLENGIFKTYRDLDLVRAVAQVVQQPLPRNEKGQLIAVPKPQTLSLRAYDNLAYSTLDFLPGLLDIGEISEPFNSNITLLKQDMNVGAYLGVRLEDKKVAEVSMPNFMQDTDIGLIAEQRLFYKPDWKSLALEYISNVDDPSYWLQLAQGDIAKETLMQRLERNMVIYLNDRPATLALLNNLSDNGQSNLVLLELERSKKYRCFVLGTVSAQMISESIETNTIPYEELPNCKAKL
ncbi:hypothetical protein [Paraglaciecola sp. L3A3]|uniref:hypothetical protein n=1 Tax=Paraglaciecola sp. L3A3 TaxID=2686358 RepID=UPI00131D7F7B|nr:hypothetical protein [Paraglaciecola sp. L3A3]